jgi:hypothetical protein
VVVAVAEDVLAVTRSELVRAKYFAAQPDRAVVSIAASET